MPNCEEFLTLKSRDFVWSDDYLDLIAKRLKLIKCNNVLDIGAGLGHWTIKISNLVAKKAKITACDLDEAWIQKLNENFKNSQGHRRINFVQANAYNLPFSDNTFDLTTCQTLLLHLAKPVKALEEMLRVTRPNGLILLSEPENFKNYFFYDNLANSREVDSILTMGKFWLLLERGKIVHGLGNNSPCSYLLQNLTHLKVKNIQIYQSDKVQYLYPPYDSLEQKILIEELKLNLHKFEDPQQYKIAQDFYLAGGGNNLDFVKSVEIIQKDLLKCLKAIDNNEYTSVTGLPINLISAQKV